MIKLNNNYYNREYINMCSSIIPKRKIYRGIHGWEYFDMDSLPLYQYTKIEEGFVIKVSTKDSGLTVWFNELEDAERTLDLLTK